MKSHFQRGLGPTALSLLTLLSLHFALLAGGLFHHPLAFWQTEWLPDWTEGNALWKKGSGEYRWCVYPLRSAGNVWNLPGRLLLAYDSDVSDIDKNVPQMSGQDGGVGTVCMEGKKKNYFPRTLKRNLIFHPFFLHGFVALPLVLAAKQHSFYGSVCSWSCSHYVYVSLWFWIMTNRCVYSSGGTRGKGGGEHFFYH